MNLQIPFGEGIIPRFTQTATKWLSKKHLKPKFAALWVEIPPCQSLTHFPELLHQCVVELPAVFEGDKAVETLALHLVRPTHRCSLRHSWVLCQSRLHLRCAHQVAWETPKEKPEVAGSREETMLSKSHYKLLL